MSYYCTPHLLTDNLYLSFCSQKIMVTNTASAIKISYIIYTWMLSFICQDVMCDFALSHHEKSKGIYECCGVGTLYSWQLDSWMWQCLPLWPNYHYEFPDRWVENILSPYLCIKIFQQNFMWYLEIDQMHVPHKSYHLRHHFYPKLGHAHPEKYHTYDLLVLFIYTWSCH
jgi:hypothetical protein